MKIAKKDFIEKIIPILPEEISITFKQIQCEHTLGNGFNVMWSREEILNKFVVKFHEEWKPSDSFGLKLEKALNETNTK